MREAPSSQRLSEWAHLMDVSVPDNHQSVINTEDSKPENTG